MTYYTVKQEGQATLVEKRSCFLGAIAPVSTEAEALSFVTDRRRQYPDARHHVYAYTLHKDRYSRYCEDGEPQGTAGVPMLNVLQKQGMWDCVAVVTRYFGGVLLGSGGLVRAYSQTLKLSLEAACPVEMHLCGVARIVCAYGEYDWVVPLVTQLGGTIEETLYTETVTVQFHAPLSLLSPLQEVLTEKSAGKLQIQKIREQFYSFGIKK